MRSSSSDFECSIHEMADILFIFFCLLINSIQLNMAEEEVLKAGGISETWWYQAVDTSKKKQAGWIMHGKFEAENEDNGAWLVTQTVNVTNLSGVMVNYHLDINGTITSCVICFLQVFICTHTKELDIPNAESVGEEKWKEAAQIYLLNNFNLLHNVTFPRNGTIETQSFNFSYNASKIRFAIQARGISGHIHNMKLYYYFCKKTVHKNVMLPQIHAPSGKWKRIAVNCTSDAVPKSNESNFEGLCLNNGTWRTENDTECLCAPGFETSGENNDNMGCKRCSIGYYKSVQSNDQCKPCPARSSSNKNYTFCTCNSDKYRLRHQKNNSTAAACYGLPSKVSNLIFHTGTSIQTVRLTWNPASDDGGLPDSLRYKVNCASPCPSQLTFTPREFSLDKTEVRISGLVPGRKYEFRVFSMNELCNELADHCVRYENKTYTAPDGRSTDERTLKLEYQIMSGVGFLLILILIVLLVFTIKYRRKRNKKQKILDNGITLPDIGQKMYIDLMNYADAETALREFANEIDPSTLSLERLIGEGEFGDVYRGTLMLKNGNAIEVAAKTLKANASEKSCQDFFLEALALGQFDDPNVIHLVGVLTTVVQKAILTEFMSNGSLDHFLKENDVKMTAIQLFRMARGVASGMKYLTSINFVHRDLAARNILVDENLVCKVADFGLSRELEATDSTIGEYFTQGGKIPVRWTAPEAIKYRIFSTTSDVWSFGILLWEIMTFAQRPYWDWDNFTVMKRVDNGFRLPPPMNCPQVVHDLMMRCWDKERSLRPRFEDIVRTIDEWIKSPESLHNLSMRDRSNQLQSAGSTTSVNEWLEEIKMSSYMPHFAAAGYERLTDLAGLLDNDLKALGVRLVGHRNKMLRSIRLLPSTNT